MSKRIICLAAILFSWFVATCLVDFVFIPNVFRNVGNLKEAGMVGVKSFYIFNILEVIFGIICFGLFFSLRRCFNKFFYALKGFLLVIPFVYFFYLSDGISKNHQAFYENDQDEQSYAIKREYYHKIYVKLDSIKLLVLLTSFLMVASNKKTKDLL